MSCGLSSCDAAPQAPELPVFVTHPLGRRVSCPVPGLRSNVSTAGTSLPPLPATATYSWRPSGESTSGHAPLSPGDTAQLGLAGPPLTHESTNRSPTAARAAPGDATSARRPTATDTIPARLLPVTIRIPSPRT